jgi:hypothetical protein
LVPIEFVQIRSPWFNVGTACVIRVHLRACTGAGGRVLEVLWRSDLQDSYSSTFVRLSEDTTQVKIAKI